VTYRSVDMACPECGTPLEQYEGRDKWRCKKCGGALVGASELELLGLLPLAAAARPRACPRCQKEMYPFEVVGVTLDQCGRDSLIWFDRGELGKLKAALAQPVDDFQIRMAAAMRYAL
jgi:Zn-finger nucleic acid-binding protein